MLRLAIGAFLVLAGLAAFFAVGGVASNTPLAVVATLLGLGVIVGPWLWALFRQLSEERRERIRSEEREEVAAHLHDSVLQTLALIQRSDGPREMASLARSQERELRDWLYGGAAATDATLLSTAVNEAAAEIERTHQVRIDVVTVGDLRLDDATRALVLAAREAMTNAARHAGVQRLSVYVESDEEGVTAFVRDQGAGFDPDDVRAGPARHRRLDPGPDGAGRRDGRDRVGAGEGDGGPPATPDAGERRGSGRPRHMIEASGSAIRIFLVDDHRLFLSGVRSELGEAFEVVGDAGDVADGHRRDRRDATGRGAAGRAPARRLGRRRHQARAPRPRPTRGSSRSR